MSDDARVCALVHAAAPPKYRIRDELECCTISGRKHTHTIVIGGPGCQKEYIGLILGVCPNPRGSQCRGHHKPLKLQMNVSDRLGLLLDLATLDPPPFESEGFVRWCCQATIALLARDTRLQDAGPARLPSGVFLAFTPTIPGFEDLPRLGQEFARPNVPVIGRARPTVFTADGEEVDVLVVIYEIDRIGPFRVLAKGKKLGALVGFTFRQPAIMDALGMSHTSRELSSYLMYEPFQQAWTKPVQPSQTLTLCEGGGVIYRHPRVKVTLWLDRHVKEIYPDWVRQGTGLHELAAIAAERRECPDLPAPARAGELDAPAASNNRRLPALPAPARARELDAPAASNNRRLPALPAPARARELDAPAASNNRRLRALPARARAREDRAAVLDAPASSDDGLIFAASARAPEDDGVMEVDCEDLEGKTSPCAIAKPDSKISGGVAGTSAKAAIVIDLTLDGKTLPTRKRKRSLVPVVAVVKLDQSDKKTKKRGLDAYILPRGGRRTAGKKDTKGKKRGGNAVSVKFEGRGTEEDPYVL